MTTRTGGMLPCTAVNTSVIVVPGADVHAGVPPGAGTPPMSNATVTAPPAAVGSAASAAATSAAVAVPASSGTVRVSRNCSVKVGVPASVGSATHVSACTSSVSAGFHSRAVASSPTAHAATEQSMPAHPASQLQPCTLPASHVDTTVASPPYVCGAASPLTLAVAASAAMGRHCPCPEQSRPPAVRPGHVMRSHAAPSNCVWHSHTPVPRLHRPLPEHSAAACAVSSAVGESNHAGPTGHARSAHAPPPHPAKHAHVYATPAAAATQVPCPLHCTAPAPTGHAVMTPDA